MAQILARLNLPPPAPSPHPFRLLHPPNGRSLLNHQKAK